MLKKTTWLILISAALVVAVDQLSKYLVVTYVPLGGAWSPFAGPNPIFQIIHTRNTGIVFGLLQNKGDLYLLILAVLAVTIGVLWRQAPEDLLMVRYSLYWGQRLPAVALGLTAGGAVGNLIDRVRLGGSVVDFIDVGIGTLRWFTSNLADVAIVTGAALLALWMFTTFRRFPQSLQFSPDGRWLVVKRGDNTLRSLDVRSIHSQPIVFNGFKNDLPEMKFSPDGHMLIAYHRGAPVRVWDLTQAQPAAVDIDPGEKHVTLTAFSKDNRYLAIATSRGAVKVCDLSDPDRPLTMLPHSGRPSAMAFSPGNRWLAVGGWHGAIELWTVADLQRPAVQLETNNFVFSLLFSPDERWLVAVIGGALHMWSTGDFNAGPIRPDENPNRAQAAPVADQHTDLRAD